MALINCPKCGKQISDRAVKCPHCGYVPGISQEEQPASSSDQLQQEVASKKTRNKWWIIPIVLMGILAVALPLWIFSNKEEPASRTTKTDVDKTYPSPYNTYYSGTIGTARGCMTIDKNGKGSYTYDCNGTDLTRIINVVSYNDKTGQLMIKSFNKSGEYVGMFDGYLDNTRLFSGTFTNYKGVTIDFRLQYEADGATPRASISSSENTSNLNSSQNNYVVIDGSELRLRLGPSTSSDTFKWEDGTNRHPKVGEKFKCLGESGDFYKIDFNGNEVWVSKQYTHLE